MKFELAFERIYPHPPAVVWQALVEPAALGQWLMNTDFVPEPGRRFQMWCETPDGGTNHYFCQVLELEPPVRMRWSWRLDGANEQDQSIVEFRLEVVPTGTRLTVHHSGNLDAATIAAFEGGWPGKLGQLQQVLRSEARNRQS